MPVTRENYDAEGSAAVLGAMQGTGSDTVPTVYSDAALFRLTKKVGVGAHEVIACGDIKELAGLIKGGPGDKEVYAVNKEGALWLNLGDEEDDAGHVESDEDSR